MKINSLEEARKLLEIMIVRMSTDEHLFQISSLLEEIEELKAKLRPFSANY